MSAFDTLLAAIQNQRWYFFENNPYIIFDRDTGLLWENSSYGRIIGLGAMHEKPEIFNEHFADYSGWKIPTPEELWKMIEDKTFPNQQGYNWRINGKCHWFVNDNGDCTSKDLDFSGSRTHMSTSFNFATHIIRCNREMRPVNYSATPREVLDIFIKNNLIPKFNDKKANSLCKICNGIFSVLRFFDADTAEINKSPIQYYESILNVADELLKYLQEHETAQAETISAFSQMAFKLNARFTESPHLTPEENSLLKERQKFLAARLELGTDDTKSQILSVKAQAEELAARIDKINHGENSINELAALESEPRVSFEFLVENMTHIVRNAISRIDFFVANKNFVAAIVNAWSAWSDDYKSFKTKLRADLKANCESGGIGENIYGAWYEDWRKKRFATEQMFLPLAEFVLKGNLIDAAEKILSSLQEYKAAVDNFYLNERKNIHQKFAFTASGDLQEKFETESELYKFTEKFQRDLQAIIFARDKTEERIFLLRWAEPLTNMPLDEIINFVHDRSLDAISAEILNQFSELSRQNFAVYISDAQIYSQALKQRDDDFNALIYKMRMDLQQK